MPSHRFSHRSTGAGWVLASSARAQNPAKSAAGEGFRNRQPQRAVIHARSAKFCWFREPGPRHGTTQNDAVRDRVGQLVGNRELWSRPLSSSASRRSRRAVHVDSVGVALQRCGGRRGACRIRRLVTVLRALVRRGNNLGCSRGSGSNYGAGSLAPSYRRPRVPTAARGEYHVSVIRGSAPRAGVRPTGKQTPASGRDVLGEVGRW